MSADGKEPKTKVKTPSSLISVIPERSAGGEIPLPHSLTMKRKKDNGPDLFSWRPPPPLPPPKAEWGGGREARDDGIGQVVDNTPEYYKVRFQAAFWYLVGTFEPFTAEDARPLCGAPPNHHNAYSGLWFGCVSRAMREGYVELIGHTQALRTSSHACDMKVYRGIDRNGH